jgi:hypothetical protein
MRDLARRYLGHLPLHDPMHRYLESEILPLLGQEPGAAEFRVFGMQGTHKVYVYEDIRSGIRVVGKFFGGRDGTASESAHRRMERELEALTTFRSYGLTGYPHHVVRPLGTNRALNSVLVEAHCPGRRLSAFLDDAVHRGKAQELYRRLTALAYFLATAHNLTANDQGADFGEDCLYLDKLIRQLSRRGPLSSGDARELAALRERWRERPRMWEDRQVLVHGDATPANFLFGEGLQVTAIDLEGMKRADRVFDVGRIAGELQHAFLQGTGNKYAAEPFIGHFLWEYACHFPDRDRAFRSITGRLPFQMAVTLLRIARNAWVSPRHRQRLVKEAKLTLKSG